MIKYYAIRLPNKKQLVVATKNIEVGDYCLWENGKPFGIVETIKDEDGLTKYTNYKNGKILNQAINDQMFGSKSDLIIFKILGKVSSNAHWVKDRDKIDIDKLFLEHKMSNMRIDIKDSNEKIISKRTQNAIANKITYKIRCSQCGHIS